MAQSLLLRHGQPGDAKASGPSFSMVPKLLARDLCAVLLLFGAPCVALCSPGRDRGLARVLFGSSCIALALEMYRQRKRCLPYPVFLVMVYALQLLCCLPLLHGDLVESTGAAPLALDEPVGTMSIVMAAHNEHKYLARTLDSIIQQTPAEVLLEILVVDDGSKPPLGPLVTGYGKVTVLRHEARRGLIKSKTEGGNAAKGDVIMFLDAHVKPEEGWYRPLLKHIGINYKRVVVPEIPILDGDTWKTDENAVGVKMMFDWSLFFNWFEDGNDLVPCMSGGLFAISRRWWHESGEYDYKMNMWGAENIEQSIRIWLCGGEIYVARDSRVAHVFRRHFPYALNNSEVYINKVRTVETWFDEYKRFYYAADPGAKQFLPFMGDISERQALRKKMQCKPFSWYVSKFQDVFNSKNMLEKEMFLIRDTVSGQCLTQDRALHVLIEVPCDLQDRLLRWGFTNKGRSLVHTETSMCLDADGSKADKVGSKVLLFGCTEASPMQEWTFRNGHLRFANLCVNGTQQTFAACGNFLEPKGPFEVYDKKAMGPKASSRA